jgi:anthranilate phosphoribosyltransferase
MNMLPDVLKKVVEGVDLTCAEAESAMYTIMSGEATDAQIGGFLAAMRMKGETVEEITAFARVMREKSSHIESNSNDVLDVVGTGGDSTGTFNISTTAAFVAAGAGVTVAKHGNRSVSSKCGSADVIRELGIDLDLPPERVSECLKKAGVSFLFAPKLHLSMKYAIGPRRELGIRTFFNVLGPLTNPAGARRIVLGVYSEELVETIAGVLANLGCDHGYVVHGRDGLDEITTASETMIAEVFGSTVTITVITPEQYGFRRAEPSDLKGGGAPENRDIFMAVLSGEKGPKRDIVLLNAGYAICAGGRAKTPDEGIELAIRSIDSGAAMERYNMLRECSRS